MAALFISRRTDENIERIDRMLAELRSSLIQALDAGCTVEMKVAPVIIEDPMCLEPGPPRQHLCVGKDYHFITRWHGLRP